MLDMTQLTYPKIGKPPQEVELHDELFLEQWVVPKGTRIKIYQTKNFGWVLLPENCLDARGVYTIPKRLFKY